MKTFPCGIKVEDKYRRIKTTCFFLFIRRGFRKDIPIIQAYFCRNFANREGRS